MDRYITAPPTIYIYIIYIGCSNPPRMDRKVGQPHIDHEIQDPRYHLSKLLDLLANKVVPPNVMFVLLNPIKKTSDISTP